MLPRGGNTVFMVASRGHFQLLFIIRSTFPLNAFLCAGSSWLNILIDFMWSTPAIWPGLSPIRMQCFVNICFLAQTSMSVPRVVYGILFMGNCVA